MSLRYALLGLLSERPAAGYDLLRRFKESLGNVWSATQSQIYTELTKLAEADLIEVSDEGPRGRKEYTITAAGLADLRAWLTGTEPKRQARNEILMRVFFLNLTSPDYARTYLTGIADRSAAARDELDALRQSVDWDDSELSRYGRIAMEWGERFHEMNEQWALWAREQLPPED